MNLSCVIQKPQFLVRAYVFDTACQTSLMCYWTSYW